jgi:hypothetical protein
MFCLPVKRRSVQSNELLAAGHWNPGILENRIFLTYLILLCKKPYRRDSKSKRFAEDRGIFHYCKRIAIDNCKMTI